VLVVDDAPWAGGSVRVKVRLAAPVCLGEACRRCSVSQSVVEKVTMSADVSRCRDVETRARTQLHVSV